MGVEIAQCEICGKTELLKDWDGKIGATGIYLDPRRSRDVKIARRFGIRKEDLKKCRAVLFNGFCEDCLEREKQNAVEGGRLYCGKKGHGSHYPWSKQFWKCVRRGDLIFSEMDLREMGLLDWSQENRVAESMEEKVAVF